MQLEVTADLSADAVETRVRAGPPYTGALPPTPAAGSPCETCSLPEGGPVGAAERQGCREMKSEPPRLGLQGPLSFPINNSGFPRGVGR